MSIFDVPLHQQWLEDVERLGVNLTVWEEDFIESIGPRLKGGTPLSEKQAEILERIYTQRVP